MARLTKDLRQKLLSKLKNGHDLQAGMASLSISEQQIESGGKTLQADIKSAYTTGTSRLRARLLELSLSSEDANSLARLIDKREEQSASSGARQISRIERVIIFKCERCGYEPDAVAKPVNPTNGEAEIDVI